MIALVCGGRDLDADDPRWYAALTALHVRRGGFTAVIHGGASGGDAIGARWAALHHVCRRAYPADWDAHGRAAGPIRNQRMLDEGRPDLVVALPGGRGTADMVRRARTAGVPVVEIGENGELRDG